MRKTAVLLIAIGTVVSVPALAQTTSPEVGGGHATTTQGEQGGNLSQKLSKSNGVIHPQTNIDPGMHVPAPDPHPNSTPVIPPSATGGNSAK